MFWFADLTGRHQSAHTLTLSHQSTLSGSFIHPLPQKSSSHNKPGIFHIIPPGTFPVALTLFLFAQKHQSNPEQAGRQAGITALWPTFPSSHHQVFKSTQVSHQRESEYEERGIIAKCQLCESRCLNTVPESVYFPLFPPLGLHQQIITFTHLQQTVQSTLSGLMAMAARES